MRVSDGSGLLTLVALIAAPIAFFTGGPRAGVALLVFALAGMAFTRWWSVRYPAPIPYLLRFTLRIPRRHHSPESLRQVLEPRPGERLLEVGPGLGIHALQVANAVGPAGTLDIFDVQQRMLDDVMRRAEAAGVTNIASRLGSGNALPYPDRTFDGAYLIGVLGEIPDRPAALRELRRVLKPEGRLVIGEVFFDSDFVAMGALAKLARTAGFVLDRTLGSPMTYLARFRPA
jgi:ubiquinone/menaquinone biosynthesis C-methylase UbiE